jgi:Family of unknown function (DUF6159)
MGKIARSWELVKASWAVLRADKELIVFPVLSTIAVTVVMVSFAVPMFLAGVFDHGFVRVGGVPLAGIFLGFGFYATQYTIIFYCNSALVGAAMIRLKGGDPGIADGFAIANRHFASIVGYALIAATVGIVLRNIARRSVLGRVVASIFGLAWNIATFLAVPVLVVEGVGPIDAVKRSTQLLKKTWGEQIAGNLGIGAAFTLAFFGVLALFAGALALAITTNSVPVIVGVVALFVLAVILMSLVGSALSAIYTAAVYRYATEGDAGGMFEAALVRDAFRPQ